MESTVSPILFPEILDLVVEEVAQIINRHDRIHALASVALTSSAMKARAHTHMFAQVAIIDFAHEMRSARQLCAILKADPQSELTGVASYIRSFAVRISGGKGFLVQAANDGTLISIMDKLFRSDKINHRGGGLLSLAFHSGPQNVHFDWNDFQPDFLASWFRLLRSPSVTKLRLTCLKNIPHYILKSTFIEEVAFGHVKFKTSENAVMAPADVSAHDQQITLKSVISTTDNYLPWERILSPDCSIQSSPEHIFSNLKEIHFVFDGARNAAYFQSACRKLDEFVLHAGQALERLTIAIGERLQTLDFDSLAPLNVQAMPSLRKLTICHHAHTLEGVPIDPIHGLLPKLQFSTHLQDMEVSYRLFRTTETFKALYDALDHFFSRPQFYTLSSLTFIFHVELGYSSDYWIGRSSKRTKHFDMERFLADTREWFRLNNVFPLITSLKDIFRFDIIIHPDLSAYQDTMLPFEKSYIL